MFNHDITEILLKVALNTRKPNQSIMFIVRFLLICNTTLCTIRSWLRRPSIQQLRHEINQHRKIFKMHFT
jgi:hypothetical protein